MSFNDLEKNPNMQRVHFEEHNNLFCGLKRKQMSKPKRELSGKVMPQSRPTNQFL